WAVYAPAAAAVVSAVALESPRGLLAGVCEFGRREGGADQDVADDGQVGVEVPRQQLALEAGDVLLGADLQRAAQRVERLVELAARAAARAVAGPLGAEVG